MQRGNRQISEIFHCTDSTCQCCENIMLQSSYTFKNTNKLIFLKSRMTCDSRNLIYLVNCSTCKERFIGEIGILESRLNKIHRQHIIEYTIYYRIYRQPQCVKSKVEKPKDRQ